MCLISSSAIPKIASTDIEVYKVIRKKRFNLYYTPYMRVFLKEYPSIHKLKQEIFNITKQTRCFKKLVPSFHGYYIETEGIYCYTNLSKAENSISTPKIFNIRYSIIKGTIPKGTKYWISTNGTEIASRYIKFEVPKFQRFAMYVRYWYLYLYKLIFKE